MVAAADKEKTNAFRVDSKESRQSRESVELHRRHCCSLYSTLTTIPAKDPPIPKYAQNNRQMQRVGPVLIRL